VVPPTRELPAPATTGSLTARDPAWPADPDEKRRAADRKAKAERKPYDSFKSGEALRPDELAAGRTDKPAVKSGQGPDYSPEMTPSQLGYTGGLWNSLWGSWGKDKAAETARFSREPPRDSLTDPPAGYRTPSRDQPYGVNARAERTKPLSGEDRQTQGMDGK
jgi:hypothetical protein